MRWLLHARFCCKNLDVFSQSQKSGNSQSRSCRLRQRCTSWSLHLLVAPVAPLSGSRKSRHSQRIFLVAKVSRCLFNRKNLEHDKNLWCKSGYERQVKSFLFFEIKISICKVFARTDCLKKFPKPELRGEAVKALLLQT